MFNKMKSLLLSASFLMASLALNAQVYLNPQAPIEERIKDALGRMTLHEKVKILHAQSKFTSAFRDVTRVSPTEYRRGKGEG